MMIIVMMKKKWKELKFCNWRLKKRMMVNKKNEIKKQRKKERNEERKKERKEERRKKGRKKGGGKRREVGRSREKT